MGTGAVYLTLSVLKVPEYRGLYVIMNIFWYLCIVFFLLNIATLVIQFLRELTVPCTYVATRLTVSFQSTRARPSGSSRMRRQDCSCHSWYVARIVCRVTDADHDLQVLSFASIIVGCINIGVPKGLCTIEFIAALFWIYTAMSVAVCMPLLMIWYNKPHDVMTMTPAWAFPVSAPPCHL